MRLAPAAASAATTRAAPPRRSVETTGAPCRAGTPVTMATRPSVRISAPMRASSAAWRKRLSKMVSVNTVVPDPMAATAITGAWASVGKPG